MTDETMTPKSTEQSGQRTPKAASSPWRYRCPNGHTAWQYRATKDVYRCKSCGLRFLPEDLVDMREDGAAAELAGGGD